MHTIRTASGSFLLFCAKDTQFCLIIPVREYRSVENVSTHDICIPLGMLPDDFFYRQKGIYFLSKMYIPFTENVYTLFQKDTYRFPKRYLSFPQKIRIIFQKDIDVF